MGRCTCPECSSEESTVAEACTSCGYPFAKERHRTEDEWRQAVDAYQRANRHHEDLSERIQEKGGPIWIVVCVALGLMMGPFGLVMIVVCFAGAWGAMHVLSRVKPSRFTEDDDPRVALLTSWKATDVYTWHGERMKLPERRAASDD